MSVDADSLYQLLPAIHRIRDAERGEPLRALLAVLAEQLRVLEENIEQLHDDQFIETCAEWVIPYIGGLVGYEPLRTDAVQAGSSRAEVAQTIALRRRKGTAAVLEQLARDVTGWNARAVEFFRTLACTQSMKHIRPERHYAPDLRDGFALEQVGSAFDQASHTVDVRRIASGRGRYAIPNVGIFLWPIEARRATRSLAVQVDARRYRVSPLGNDMPLYNRPLVEESITHIAEPTNVPMPLSRRLLEADVRFAAASGAQAESVYYGAERSLALYLNGATAPVNLTDLCVCNLSDQGANWAHLPEDKIAIDPVLGRIALPEQQDPAIERVEVTYHYGFGAELGGGEYERNAITKEGADELLVLVPGDKPTIQAALDALGANTAEGGEGVIVVTDSGRYREALTARVRQGKRITLRSPREDTRFGRPSIVLSEPFTLYGGSDSEFVLEGLLVSGSPLRVPSGDNALASLQIAHSTLVPGLSLTERGEPESPDAPSLWVEVTSTKLYVTRSIVGAVRAPEGTELTAADSILDATRVDGVLLAGLDATAPGPSLTLEGCTTIGKVHASAMPHVSNSLLIARSSSGDEPAVRVERRQNGCVRFSWLPVGSRVPHRHRCLPAADGTPAPRMKSLRYGTPTYARLASSADPAIRRGADDDGEVGAYHHLLAPVREANLRVRLDEYLRAGLEAGLLIET